MENIQTIKVFTYFIIPPILAFTELSRDIVHILAILIFIDLFTAVLRELILQTSRFKSRTLWVGVVSKSLLILIPMMLILVGKGIGIDMKWLAQLTLSILILAEAYSILGNITQIRQADKTLDEQDAVTLLIRSIESVIKQIISTILAKVKR